MQTYDELMGAASALQNWFKSQDLGPAEAAMVTEIFYAKLVVANSSSKAEAQIKVDFITSSVRALVSVFNGESPDAR